jgi:hypothetical protein
MAMSLAGLGTKNGCWRRSAAVYQEPEDQLLSSIEEVPFINKEVFLKRANI